MRNCGGTLMRRHRFRYPLLFAAICVVSSCSGTPKPLPVLPRDVRSSLGTVGVLTSGPPVGGKVDGPVGVGKEAAVGVLEGAAIGTPSGFVTGGLLGLICGPGAWLCVPVGAIGGGIIGLVGGGVYGGVTKANNAIPENAAREIQTALVQALAGRDLQFDLRNEVL